MKFEFDTTAHAHLFIMEKMKEVEFPDQCLGAQIGIVSHYDEDSTCLWMNCVYPDKKHHIAEVTISQAFIGEEAVGVPDAVLGGLLGDTLAFCDVKLVTALNATVDTTELLFSWDKSSDAPFEYMLGIIAELCRLHLSGKQPVGLLSNWLKDNNHRYGVCAIKPEALGSHYQHAAPYLYCFMSE